MTTTSAGQSPGTNLGPLTTTFTPPAACSTAIVECESSCALAFWGQKCMQGIGGAGCRDAKTCWPRAIVTNTDYQLSGWGYYSPGLICPSGYVSACSATADGSSGWSQQFSMAPSETAVGCCPSGFACSAPNGIQSCYSYASSGASVAVGTCRRGNTQSFSYLTLPSGGTTVTNQATTNVINGMPTFTVQAPLIEIRYRSQDVTLTAGSTASGSTGPSSSTSSSDSDSDSSLSTGAIVAIAVVIPVVVIAVLVIAFSVWRHRKKKSPKPRRAAELDNNQVAPHHSPPPTDKKPLAEQDAPPIQEMEAKDPYHELDTEHRTYELEDNRPVQRE